MGLSQSLHSDSIYELDKFIENTKKKYPKKIIDIVKKIMAINNRPLSYINFYHIIKYLKSKNIGNRILFRELFMFFYNYNKYSIDLYGKELASSRHKDNITIFMLCIYQTYIENIELYKINPYKVYDLELNEEFYNTNEYIKNNHFNCVYQNKEHIVLTPTPPASPYLISYNARMKNNINEPVLPNIDLEIDSKTDTAKNTIIE